MKIEYHRASTENELRQILALQKNNAVAVISEAEREKEGFVTVTHTYAILKRMNDACAHIIAKDGDIVVGYALVMLPAFKNDIPLLKPMFATADALLPNTNYLAMGQICIAKNYRSKGIFRGMYHYYKEQLLGRYDGLFTEVATNNTRSLYAHQSVGFTILKTEITDGISWELLYWDWHKIIV